LAAFFEPILNAVTETPLAVLPLEFTEDVVRDGYVLAQISCVAAIRNRTPRRVGFVVAAGRHRRRLRPRCSETDRRQGEGVTTTGDIRRRPRSRTILGGVLERHTNDPQELDTYE
jgi:hypothetical protein